MGSCPSVVSRGKFSPEECGKKKMKNGSDGGVKMRPVDDRMMISYCSSEGGATRERLPMDYSDEEEEDQEKEMRNRGSVPLIVEDVDLCVDSNASSHRTAPFHRVRHSRHLVVRRGAPFRINLELNRPFEEEKDILCLVFMSKDAPSPSYSQNTEIVLPVFCTEQKKELPAAWQVKVVEAKGHILMLEVIPSPVCIVGGWMLEVDSRSKEQKGAPGFRYTVPDPITVLFNPWCEDDAVYLAEEERRCEYVLCDSGLVWRGSHNCLRPCVWNYAQFEENILDCCLYLLSNVGHLKIVERADPVSIVRHLSAVLNSRDDNGVVVGSWSGKYKKGKSPTCWAGSQTILQKYYKKKKPVKYGQCWVFAGVFTTVCRALGIPARPVTIFSSAHDTHSSLTVDRFFDIQGRPIHAMNADSVWSFHVWGEAWMQRPDLEPGGYGGWQAADCAPHEESDGVFRCGPASVAAVRRGEVQRAFDTHSLFAEVNADTVYWRYHSPHQPLKLIRKDDDQIGQCISTKAVGKYEREDITHEYKKVERSCVEREVMLRALSQCKNAFSRYFLNEESEDVHFEFTLLDDILIGDAFTVKLKASDKRNVEEEEAEKMKLGQEVYTVKVSLNVYSALYTGEIKKLVKRDEFEIQLAPGVENVMKMCVLYDEYARSLCDQCSFVVTAAAHVLETGFDFCAQDDFRVRMPDISIQVDGEIVLDHPVTVTATLTNPLPRPLQSCEFMLEGPGFEKPAKIPIKKIVPAGGDAKVKCKMIPTLPGAKVVIAKFRSREMEDVDGYHSIVVKSFDQVVAGADKESHL